jgi:nitrite reductase/ring-hydroxylating ferredoxin subunit
MNDRPWTDIGPASDFPAGDRTCVEVAGQRVVVFNIDGSLFAIENRCPHAGLPLDDGERAGLTLTCAHHGYTYNIKTGKDVDDPAYGTPVPTLDVRADDGRVLIRSNDDDAET